MVLSQHFGRAVIIASLIEIRSSPREAPRDASVAGTP